MSIFEQASRLKLRFATARGVIGVEELWDLPLQSKTGVDLDNVAKAVNRELKTTEEESFVAAATPASSRIALSLEVVKHVIAVRLVENEQLRTASARAAERQKLLGILGDKQDEALKALTPEQIQERLASLS